MPPFHDDVREVPELELAPEREAIELVGEDRALLGRLSARLQMRPAAVVRLALIALARRGPFGNDYAKGLTCRSRPDFY